FQRVCWISGHRLVTMTSRKRNEDAIVQVSSTPPETGGGLPPTDPITVYPRRSAATRPKPSEGAPFSGHPLPNFMYQRIIPRFAVVSGGPAGASAAPRFHLPCTTTPRIFLPSYMSW